MYPYPGRSSVCVLGNSDLWRRKYWDFETIMLVKKLSINRSGRIYADFHWASIATASLNRLRIVDLFRFGGIFSFFPLIPPAFKNINILKSFIHQFPCQTDTGVFIRSCSVQYNCLCFGIPRIPAIKFVWIFLNCAFDFNAAFLPILWAPNI